jgi:hypothetical protein
MGLFGTQYQIGSDGFGHPPPKRGVTVIIQCACNTKSMLMFKVKPLSGCHPQTCFGDVLIQGDLDSLPNEFGSATRLPS